MADYGKVKSTRLTGTGDVKAIGGPAYIHKIYLFNIGTAAGTSGSVEVRDAAAAAASTGTLRFDFRDGALDADLSNLNKDISFPAPLYMPDGIHVVFSLLTNMVVWVLWEG